MKLASFSQRGVASYGIVQGDMIADCGAALSATYLTLREVLAADALPAVVRGAAGAPLLPLSGVTLLPVIPRPDKILCVGLNYGSHQAETGRGGEANPTIFTRFHNSQTGHGTDLLLPRVSTKFDYEGELAVIIGRGGRYISRAAAWDHVAGYSIYNDGSIRDWQNHTSQFTPGKNFEATGGFGPWMVTPDEMGALGPQRLETRLNGQLVQQATLAEMVFDVPRILEYISSFTRLAPGDVIATGTPGGVGAKRTPPLWMKPGDHVAVSIDGIGTLENRVAAEPTVV